ncbi:alcohol dehydrogenase catalytic domain-containing protein [Liquorilactobacillus vini]|uniref:alcohol dehydrogenase catalytic domain-containing protein n=1 Tax=Liquorilactobacillus vini TaxID=238015 RepID=UPI0003196EAF|nr:alcohol dehydrogenase catalytic domain-containing protein [Liquorilactobacillus vini]
MKAGFFYNSYGQPIKQLKCCSTSLPKLAADEVSVKMEMFPVNPSDLIPVTGAYAARISLPQFVGYEGVGRVTAVGSKVATTWLNKRVLPLRGEGTWQTQVKTRVKFLVEVPEELPAEVACRMYINPLTAFLIVNRAMEIKPQTRVLLSGGNSQLNYLLIQLCRKLACAVDVITRSEQSRAALVAQGSHRVYLTGEKLPIQAYDYTIDSVGDLIGRQVVKATKFKGNFLSVGLLSGNQIPVAVFKERADLKLDWFFLRQWNQTLSVQTWHYLLTQLVKSVSQNQLQLASNYRICTFTELKSNLNLLSGQPKLLVKVNL